MKKSGAGPGILVVDDDTELLQEVRTYLEREGYDVATAADGRTAVNYAQSHELDLVVLDISFPEPSNRQAHVMDGIEVLRILREAGDLPILMLSSTNITSVKIMALNLGADDYLAKPFDVQELKARIDAVLRRTGKEAPGERILTFRRLKMDPGKRRVWKDGVTVELTGIEFDILYTLAQHPEYVFSRRKIIEHVWKDSYQCVPKAVDVHIAHIRKKIEGNPTRPTLIATVRGTGYRFQDIPA